LNIQPNLISAIGPTADSSRSLGTRLTNSQKAYRCETDALIRFAKSGSVSSRENANAGDTTLYLSRRRVAGAASDSKQNAVYAWLATTGVAENDCAKLGTDCCANTYAISPSTLTRSAQGSPQTLAIA
jgi:hypothetical protein